MTSVFISYSSKDRTIANFIARRLVAHGAGVFIDYEGLQAGQDFIGRLGKEIEKSDYFVLLVSPRSLASKWVRAEIGWAFTRDITIIPVLLEPASYEGVFVIAPLHHIDFTRWSVDGRVEAAMQELIAALNLPPQPVQPDAAAERIMTVDEDKAEDDEEAAAREAVPVNFAREDLSEMFFTAMEVQDDEPEEALFLLQQVVETDPDFLKGRAREFVERTSERLKPLRLQNLLTRAEEAIQQGAWTAAQRIAEDMQAIENNNADARRIHKLCESNFPCEPIYKQAQIAAERGRWRAVLPLLTDIQETCPDYGDPSRLFLRAMSKGKSFQMPAPFDWCDIPAGTVVVKNQTFKIDAFQMAKYPITNAQFQVFIDDPNGYRNPIWWNYSEAAKNWRSGNNAPNSNVIGGPSHPRVYVTWYEALAFCRWLGAILEMHISLPTEAEWQWAAVGNKGWDYPYGKQFDASKSNTEESGIGTTTPVDHYPEGASPFGVMDMSGNIYEWCLNEYAHPASVDLNSTQQKTLRGGSWNDARAFARSAFRYDSDPNYRDDDYGFRVVVRSSPFSMSF
jgi:formylglycine-generating enzyme required for sulfatase activity